MFIKGEDGVIGGLGKGEVGLGVIGKVEGCRDNVGGGWGMNVFVVLVGEVLERI